MADAVLAYSCVRSSGLDLSSGLLDLSTSGGVTPSGPAFGSASQARRLHQLITTEKETP